MTVSMRKTLAALHLPTQAPALISIARAILAAMAGKAAFPNPTPSLATVAAALDDLQRAQVMSAMRTRGTVAARNEKRTVLVGLLVRLKGYVQGIADADPERAAALIESAGMDVKRTASRTKPPFEARPGAVSGSLRLAARSAGDRASYEWAWSTDGGQTWRTAPATLQARTVLSGLAPATVVSLRCRAVVTAGPTDWSQPVAVLVR